MQEQIFTVELTRSEVSNLVSLLDAGVRGTGLQSAQAAAILDQKIGMAIKAAEQEASED